MPCTGPPACHHRRLYTGRLNQRPGRTGFMTQQLPLQIELSSRATFGNFIAGGNGQILSTLENWTRGQFKGDLFYLWGSPGSGRSHLLAAACNLVQERGGDVAYIALAEYENLATAVTEELETRRLICLDDINKVAGNHQWEAAVFHLFNRVRDAGNLLLMTADSGPLELPCQLPDLKTRLAWGLTYRLAPLSDAGKRELLRQQATERGLELSPAAIDYLLARFPRDTKSLVHLIEKLDTAALAAQRGLTIPFLRSQIEILG